MTADADLSRDPSTPTMADMKEPCSSNNDDTEVANAGEENQEDAKQQPAKKRARAASKRTMKKADVDVNGDASTKTTTDMEEPCRSNKEESEATVSEPTETSTAKLNANQERDTEASAETTVGIQPHGKQTRRRKGAKPSAAFDFPEEVSSEARKIGYEPLLRNLASRPEIISNGASAAAMLEALKSSGGLVNAAKHALLRN